METKNKLINLKVNETEYNEIKKRAEQMNGGNISKWIRRAAREYMPTEPHHMDMIQPSKPVETVLKIG